MLFLANHEEYFNVDGWPAENDRQLYYRVTSEIPLLQDTLIRIFMVGLSRSNQMTARDAVSLAEMMVKRAAGLHHNFGDGSAAAASASETDFPALQGPNSIEKKLA